MNENAIFKATHKATGEVIWVDDLYWFEVQGIHDMSGADAFGGEWKLEFVWIDPMWRDLLERDIAVHDRTYYGTDSVK